MSCNISSTALYGALQISRGAARRIMAEFEAKQISLPECNTFENIAEGAGEDAEIVEIGESGFLDWHGSCSRRGEESLAVFLTATTGHADIILCWEGGDSYSGLRVRDGIVSFHGVRLELLD